MSLVGNHLRWKQAPKGSLWGEFGADDQRGRMNLIGPAQVRNAVRQVIEGITFCLSLPLDYPGGQALNPKRIAPRRYATLRDGKSAGQQSFCWAYELEDPELSDVVNDDVVLMSLQYSTQWDSLAHVGSRFDADADGHAEMVFYNGFRAGRDLFPAQTDGTAPEPLMRFPEPRADALGIENLATHGVQGRGVLLDFDRHFGRQRLAIGYEALMRLLDKDGIEIESGDMVCVHTGFSDNLLAMKKKPDVDRLYQTGSGLDGHDARLLRWIVDSKLSCLVADNPAVELVVPKLLSPTPMRRSRLPLHEHCLFKCGIHLGELWYLTELALWLRQHNRHYFLLTAPPLRLPGAVGSPVTPIATV